MCAKKEAELKLVVELITQPLAMRLYLNCYEKIKANVYFIYRKGLFIVNQGLRFDVVSGIIFAFRGFINKKDRLEVSSSRSIVYCDLSVAQ